VDEFESLTHCAQWKPLWARIVDTKAGSGDQQSHIPTIELFQRTATGQDLVIPVSRVCELQFCHLVLSMVYNYNLVIIRDTEYLAALISGRIIRAKKK
jgi:hypothetical protein